MNKPGYSRPALAKASTTAKVLLAGLLTIVLSAGTILAASQEPGPTIVTADPIQPTGVQPHAQPSRNTLGIAGDPVALLSPGATVPLNVSFSNNTNKSLAVNRLSVRIAGITQTQEVVAAALPCTSADYRITDYSGSYPLAIPAGPSSLQSAGIPPANWPKITMMDTPLNQDGCKGATLQLAYTDAIEAN